MGTTLLTKNQKKFMSKTYHENGREYLITATVRYDDDCGNGHNSFAITGTIWRARNGQRIGRDCETCGCIHDEIAKRFPYLAPLLKWHLMNSDEPMYYIEDTLYHALAHGPKYAWVSYDGGQDPMKVITVKGFDYLKAEFAQLVEGKPRYTVKWDDKSAKVANLDHARSCAVWPEATDEDLTAPGLEMRLQARLPGLMAEFRKAIESLGFTY
jgi:hypothetical protein